MESWEDAVSIARSAETTLDQMRAGDVESIGDGSGASVTLAGY